MILAVALQISITLLIVVHVVVSLLIVLVVMMQRPKQEGLGAAFGSGMTDQLLGAGTTSFLQKATVWLGCLFFLISLVLAILIGRSNQQQGLTTEAVTPTEEVAAPAVPADIDLKAEEEDELLEALDTATAEVVEEMEAEEAPETTEEAPATQEEAPAEEVAPEAAEVEDAAPEATEESAPASDAETESSEENQ